MNSWLGQFGVWFIWTIALHFQGRMLIIYLCLVVSAGLESMLTRADSFS